jgi:flagellar biosynthesis/type III secretory pathway M-ring protein FliF/YscJ
MDIATLGFVAFLCLVAFFVTATVRRDYRAKEQERREQERQSRHQPPQRKP